MDSRHLERITALLAKAERTTPHEAEAFTAKATALMVKYGIEQAHIDATRDAGKPVDIITKRISFPGVYGPVKAKAGAQVALAFGTVRALASDFRRTQFTPAGRALWIVGFPSDVQQITLLIESLDLQCQRALDEWWAQLRTRALTGHEKFVARRSFVLSYGQTVASRIREHLKQQTSTGTDLVLADRRALVDAFIADQMNTRNDKNRKMRLSAAGFHAGHAAGKRADLGLNGAVDHLAPEAVTA